MVVGEGEKMPAAIIQPNFEYLTDWASENNITYNSNEELIANERVLEEIANAVKVCNANFGKWEQIKVFKLTPDEWSIDGGHLTPTMKMKRAIIKEIYKDLYNEIYSC